MQAGSWYEVDGAPGIFASVMQPGMIAQSVFDVAGRQLGSTAWRAGRMFYLVAFDMSQFELGYELGTDHPQSRLVLAPVRTAPRGGPGRVFATPIRWS